MSAPFVDENRVLPVSLRVLITVTVAIVVSIVYVVTSNVQITNRIDTHENRINKFETKQDKQDEKLSYLETLMIRIADKFGVDTSDPRKTTILKNMSTDIFFPL